ncbi:hypothetical protein CYLTODRAFT_122957 [Cylindrobasidium torrendii FP15055 ss-10]|uniref:Uncharacterized protein n=1 Tax=Cylindrobasidium torrendii FP15055 ss-10 TaxID=1314674 RepID=A0A0D7BML0_9AGAR|nr:hypothetical protein CYLTODRAFT_122957 [Cylindrobasidium torrendii FP15055 ss-10]
MNYWPHVVYSIAITSCSVHLVTQKNEQKDEKSRVDAKISVLESIASRLKQGERIQAEEMARLQRLVASHSTKPEEGLTWREAFFGKKDIAAKPESTNLLSSMHYLHATHTKWFTYIAHLHSICFLPVSLHNLRTRCPIRIMFHRMWRLR